MTFDSQDTIEHVGGHARRASSPKFRRVCQVKGTDLEVVSHERADVTLGEGKGREHRKD